MNKNSATVWATESEVEVRSLHNLLLASFPTSGLWETSFKGGRIRALRYFRTCRWCRDRLQRTHKTGVVASWRLVSAPGLSILWRSIFRMAWMAFIPDPSYSSSSVPGGTMSFFRVPSKGSVHLIGILFMRLIQFLEKNKPVKIQGTFTKQICFGKTAPPSKTCTLPLKRLPLVEN